MGEDCGSYPPHQHFDWQIQNQNSLTPHMNLGTHMVSTNGNFPVHAVAELHNLRMRQASEPHGWFYCLPQFQQGFTPVEVSTVKEIVPHSPYEKSLEVFPPNPGHGCVEKRFIVFDQSGDQTTLIFGSGTRKRVQFPTWIKQFPGVPGLESDINQPLEPILTSELKNHDMDEVGEMHEDTEELNALLYSDDESGYTEDDEVTSTGHSPGSITDHGKSDGSNEEVASCNKPAKKRKLCDEDHHKDRESLEDTASSGNPKRSTEYALSDRMDSSSENKRTRKEKIKETISILQRMIPSGKGKDAIVVLDEAIEYLTSLKLKAKALGLGAL